MDWEPVSLAGAFVLGLAAGLVVALRLFRIVANIIRQERDE